MATWQRIHEQVPELAEKVQGRFDAHGLGFIATIRRNGGPRVSGLEPLFAAGHLWLGMMPGSLKAKDILRDGRFALHSASIDKDVRAGDAKVSGVAIPVEDESTFALYREASRGNGSPPPGSMNLFYADVKDVSHLIPAGDHLDIESWSETKGYRRVERR